MAATHLIQQSREDVKSVMLFTANQFGWHAIICRGEGHVTAQLLASLSDYSNNTATFYTDDNLNSEQWMNCTKDRLVAQLNSLVVSTDRQQGIGRYAGL